MKKSVITSLLAISILSLVGCKGSFVKGEGNEISGTAIDMSNGTEMSYSIATASGLGGSASAGMWATNPKTGEEFKGRWSAIINSKTGFSYNQGNSSGKLASNSFGGNSYNYSGSSNGWTTTTMRDNQANATGFLVGDKGTVINVKLDIKPGFVPTGHGEGMDNKGNRYQFYF